jgi:4-amino-4-deoxy-L-arabinose transferase-like glycosyltransferase
MTPRSTPRWTSLVDILIPATLLLVLLLAQLPADPAAGVTFSNSPFTDEAWNVMGARNWILLGDWGAGDWALHLVQLPFNALEAVGFAVLGVGIVQARLIAALCSVAAVALVSAIVRRRLGSTAGFIAGLGLAGTGLVLYYGRLAYVETLVMLALVAGVAALCWRPSGSAGWQAAAAGALLAVAIGTKPSALFAVVGILVGVALATRRGAWLRRTMLAAGMVALAAVGWIVVIALPNAEQVGWVLDIWTSQAPPEDLGELVRRIIDYPASDDGVLLMSLPLVIGGVAGLFAAIARWRSLDDGQRALAGAAIGWLLVGLGVLLIASYRPNRYSLPVVPALAILSGYLVPAAAAGLRLRSTRLALPLTGAAVIALLLPGVVMYGGWAAAATSRAPMIQAEVAAAIDGRPVEGGLAPLFAMRAPVRIHVRWSTSEVNWGDLYADAGVRWLVMADAYQPSWAALHEEAWEARTPVLCYAWGRGTQCLVRLP